MAIQQTFDFLDRCEVVQPLSTDFAGEDESLPLRKSRALRAGEGQCLRESSNRHSEEPSPAATASDPPASVTSKETDRKSVLRELRAKVGCVSTAADGEVVETLSTGSDAINRLLPRAGLRLDAITEWVAEADGSGAAALSMIAVATHLRSPRGCGPLVVVCGQSNFYPPAAVALGVPAERIVLVRPTRHADLVWAIDQALRCESVAAVWAHVGANLDDRDARRFQLAAETGRTPGLFVRPAATRGRPSFADVRLHVQTRASTEPLGRAMNVTLDRCRGGTIGHSVWVQIDDQMIDERGGRCVARIHQVTPQQLGISENETAAVRLASELAHPKNTNRRASRRRA
jgi:hypothetical protein